MSTEGTKDIADVLRQLGREALVREAENAGLKPRANRMRCAFEGCRGKSPEESVQLYTGKRGEWRLKCHRCGTTGSLVDLLAATRNWSEAEAIAHLHGQNVDARPRLAVVPAPSAPPPDKLKPSECADIWKQLATEDVHGLAYLAGRGLDGATELGLVRFAHAKHSHRAVKHWHMSQRLVVMELRDVVGNPRGFQGRLVREVVGDEPKQRSFAKSDVKAGFLGHPEMIESSGVVAVTEGMADTLAVALWSADKDVALAGAAGMDFLKHLAPELERCGIGVEGKVFALFVQNDRPANRSRRAFEHLGRLLAKAGATVDYVSPPEEYKDVADWRRAQPDMQWPPAPLAMALTGSSDASVSTDSKLQLAPGTAVPAPTEVEVGFHAQDLRTLLKLLGDATYREALLGPGDFTWCEMTKAPRFAGRPLADVDITTIRLGLEGVTRDTDNKPLKFGHEDIASVIELVARRKSVHPVRDWLNGLKSNGAKLLSGDLPLAFALEPDSLSATLLRRWMVAAVARAMRPGCKVDTVLVLVGPQGVGKSSFFSALAGEWFTDSPVNIGDKDGLMVMSRSWVVEWAELDAMRRARDQEALKAFLSQSVDHYRPPYARRVVEVPRSCVIVGTTNNTEFLHDPTGNRRFWPIKAECVALDWVREQREQLWAEAVELYRAGEQWWLTREEEAQLTEANREYLVHDGWQEPVSDWLDQHALFTEVTVAQVLVDALAKPLEKHDRSAQMRVAGILGALGWQRERRRKGGELRWVYVRPE